MGVQRLLGYHSIFQHLVNFTYTEEQGWGDKAQVPKGNQGKDSCAVRVER